MLRVIPKIEKHEPHKNAAVISGVMEGLELPTRDTSSCYCYHETNVIGYSQDSQDFIDNTQTHKCDT
jgi:hypothetical protein